MRSDPFIWQNTKTDVRISVCPWMSRFGVQVHSTFPLTGVAHCFPPVETLRTINCSIAAVHRQKEGELGFFEGSKSLARGNVIPLLFFRSQKITRRTRRTSGRCGLNRSSSPKEAGLDFVWCKWSLFLFFFFPLKKENFTLIRTCYNQIFRQL